MRISWPPQGGQFTGTAQGKCVRGGVRARASTFGARARRFATVGTKIIADLEKCFQESISLNLLILLRDRPCQELIIVSSNFRGFTVSLWEHQFATLYLFHAYPLCGTPLTVCPGQNNPKDPPVLKNTTFYYTPISTPLWTLLWEEKCFQFPGKCAMR